MALKRVPTDSNQDKQHRTVIATTVNELVKTRAPFDGTDAEAGAGVTPIDYGYPPSIDERRFGAEFPGDPRAVAKVLDSAREQDIPRIPTLGVGAALRPLVSYEDRTVYVNPSTGSDNNTGLTTAAPLATIQEAINRIPIFLYHLYRIDLITALASAPTAGSPVEYDEDVLISSLFVNTRGDSHTFISQNLEIIGVGVDPLTADSAAVRVGSFTAVNTHGLASVYLQGIQMMRISPFYETAEAIAIYGSGELLARNISFDAAVGAASGAGIRCYGARGSLRDINCDNVTNGVWAKRSAQVVCSNFTGTPSAQTYRSEEAAKILVINDGTTTGTDPRDKFVTNGGEIRTLEGWELKVTREFLIGMPLDVADVLGDDATAIGYKVRATSASSVAVGTLATANTGASNTAVGASAVASGSASATALGTTALASGASAIAIGPASEATAASTVAIGNNANATSTQAVALGLDALASSGTNNVALGSGSTASGNDAAIAVGPSSVAGRRAVAIGRTTTASGENSVALGNAASATADNAVSIACTANTVAAQVRVGTGGTHTVVLALAASAPSDANMPNGSVSFYNAGSGDLGIKMKDAGGTVSVGTVTLT